MSSGVGSSSMIVQAVKNLPQQQQLLICAATKLLGGGGQEQPAASIANQPARSSLSGLPRKVSLKGTADPSYPLGKVVQRRMSLSILVDDAW